MKTSETGRKVKKIEGVVSSDRMDKTITVKVERLVPHPILGKYIRRYTKYKAHDEKNAANLGDRVEIINSRPLSKTKCWRYVRTVEAAK